MREVTDYGLRHQVKKDACARAISYVVSFGHGD